MSAMAAVSSVIFWSQAWSCLVASSEDCLASAASLEV